jgi:hypothetical protein
VAGVPPDDPVLGHVDDQIRWYDESARHAMDKHFRLRGAQIVAAAAIPITQIFPTAVAWRIAAGILGGFIAVCQGFDSMHHYGDHYVAWRATCQQLLRQRQLFAAGAGEYQSLDPPSRAALGRLAERIDSIEAQEQQRWAAGQASSSGAINAETK